MRTTFDCLTILYQLASPSVLKTAITGDVYKLQRPDIVKPEDAMEDVVVNSLPLTMNQIQLGSGNVNIYVPDLSVTVHGKTLYMPNTARLNELAALAIPIFQEQSAPRYNLWLTNQTTIAEPESHSHYVNLRIDFKFHNIN